MTNRNFYSKSPVIEAIVDLRTAQPDDFIVSKFIEIFQKFTDEFPNREEMRRLAGQVHFPKGMVAPEVTGSQSHLGYRFTSRDRQKILQVRTDGFTFSHLAPYGKWEDLRDDAKRFWNVYCRETEAKEVTRVAVRYINRLDLPEESDAQEYITTSPAVSPSYEYGVVSNFFMQLQIAQPDIEAMLILNETLTEPLSPDVFSIILDLDLFIERPQAPWNTSDDDSVWASVEDLHLRNYQIFEASITDKMRELIK